MKYIGILSVLSVLLVGFGYYTLFTTPANETTSQVATDQESFAMETEPAITETVAEERQGVGTLDELRLLSENLECAIVYSPAENATSVEGTYFVSNGNMRGDFLTDTPDLSGQLLSSMIIDGTTMYVWSEIDGVNYGVQMSLGTLQDDTIVTNEPIALDADVTYDCTPWENVDNTVFLPPSSVLFQDINAMNVPTMESGVIYEEGEF